MEYATGRLDRKLFVSRCPVALPKAEELNRLIEEDRGGWEERREGGR